MSEDRRTKRKATGASTSGRSEATAGRSVSRWVALVAIAALGIFAAVVLQHWSTGRRQTAAQPPPVRDNILLVTLDTTRADRLGCYGYAKARTRHIDRLAAEGVRFEHAFSPAPITLPAHASILTGLYPFEHGVRNNGNFYLSERFDTLATRLSTYGYPTAAFVSAFVLDRRYGLARGFDVYDDRMQVPPAQVVSLEAERRGDRTELALAAWLDQQAAGGRPFFAWLHLYDPHEPYRPPNPFRDAFADSPYDGEIAFTDAIVAAVLDRLSQLGMIDHTIVAVIGDHGESLGDHGEETHSMFVYDAAIRVPLLLWRPGRLPAGRVISEPVRATDLAPTLLELVGAPPLEVPHGRSLLPAINGTASRDAPPIYAETYLPRFYLNWAPLLTLRDDRWKFIDAPKPELYDLSNDAAEYENLTAAQPRTAEAMRVALERLTGGSTGSMNSGRLDQETVEKLAALGYVGVGAATDAAPQNAAERDPKDVIGLFNRLRRANSAVRDRRFADALPILHEVLAEDPRNAFAQLVLGSAYMGMEEYRTAIEQYRKYLAIVPTSSYAHQWIAICYVRLGDQENALREAAAALTLDPKSADAHVLRGGILASRGRYDDALSELRAAVDTDPTKPMVRLDLARVLDEAGRRDEARTEYRTILSQQSDYTPALTGLGALEARSGRLDEALELLRRSVEIDPSQDTTRFDLARTLEQQGRRREAADEYRRLAKEPGTSHAVREAAAARLSALTR
jgi:arylsulfatase A-like enzyme/Tfp pilus assembly protein PilF